MMKPSTRRDLISATVFFGVRDQGGITYDVDKLQPVGAVDKWAVSDRAFQQVVERGDFTRHDVRRYLEDHEDILSESGAYLGAWWDEESDRVYLDVTRLYESRAGAEVAGQLFRQKAIYNLATGEKVWIDRR